jgi:hypothetical protein
MTSNWPLQDSGKVIGDVPSATAILHSFLHHAKSRAPPVDATNRLTTAHLDGERTVNERI